MIIDRRSPYPKVKVYGLYYAWQPRNDLLLREIQKAIKDMPANGQIPNGELRSSVEGQQVKESYDSMISTSLPIIFKGTRT